MLSRNFLRSAKTLLIRGAGPVGLNAVAWRLTSHRPRILMYHRFAQDDTKRQVGRETFRRQIRALKSRCRIVTLAELATVLRTEPEQARRLAVITVDDGYRDFYEFAWPVLREEGVSATFFPVTGFVDHQIWLWPDLVEYVLEHGTARRVDSEDLGLPEGGRNWSLANPDDKSSAWQALIEYAIDLDDDEKWAFLRNIFSRLEVAWPDTIPEKYAPVSWEELRELARHGIEIGAHTRTHCRLTRVDDTQLEDELSGAKSRLESQLGCPVVSLCYPNGAKADYDARVVEAARVAGYSVAVTAFFDGVMGELYDLRRHGIDHDMYGFRKSLFGLDELSARFARNA